MYTAFEQNLHFYVMFKTNNRKNDEIKQIKFIYFAFLFRTKTLN